MEEKKNTIIQTMVNNFKKSKNTLIIQIFWIVVIGIIIHFFYPNNSQSAKQETKEQIRQNPGITEEQRDAIIHEICTQQEEDKLKNYSAEEQDALRKYVSPQSYKDCVENLKQPTKPGRTWEDLNNLNLDPDNIFTTEEK